MITATRIVFRVRRSSQLDTAGTFLLDLAHRTPLPEIGKRASELLGHSAHPPLTDLPIGFWTSAWLIDIVAPGHRDVARQLIGWGIVSAVPTAAAGLADLPGLTTTGRRVATVHVAANSAALGLYVWSWTLRRRGRHGHGVLVSWLAAAAATAGGALGGHLAFADGQPSEDQRPEDQRPEDQRPDDNSVGTDDERVWK